jgi:heme oxygenase
MGTFAKRLGQVAARSVETEGARILQQSAANKIEGSLAKALDSTLHAGHDMSTFGLGTAASLASRARYGRFTQSMHAVYAAMERELDATCTAAPDAPTGLVWARHGDVLRRGDSLLADLGDVGLAAAASDSAATAAYLQRIQAAGEADRADAAGSARLLGHVYCRYFADLFGGQMLGFPTAAALDLPAGTPRHYDFGFGQGSGCLGRRGTIEAVYASLNDAGEQLGDAGRAACVEEALGAFAANVNVYAEEPMWADAARGALNVAVGVVTGRGK